MSNFSFTKTHKSFSLELLSIHSTLRLYLCLGWLQHGCRILQLVFWNSWDSHKPTPQAYQGPSGIPFLQHVGWTPQFGLGEVAEGALIPPSLMLTKILSVVGPDTRSWGMLLINNLHLDWETLTAAFWVQPSIPYPLSATPVKTMSLALVWATLPAVLSLNGSFLHAILCGTVLQICDQNSLKNVIPTFRCCWAVLAQHQSLSRARMLTVHELY